ncbi:MAG: ABC transporter ATP-binding protein [Actinomycetota bacterium]|nr:ABC transporter ATP-binding protein [Actinomycetota bacterium]
MTTPPKLTVDDVSLVYEGRRGRALAALDHVSLVVRENELCVLVGTSGCGKSTLLRLIAGLMQPSSGSIKLDGQEIVGPSKSRGMVFQSYTLFPWLTVRENVEFGSRFRSLKSTERTEISRHFISVVGLEEFEDAYPKALSGGMRQRVAIARALANDPEVILMDEPFGALDAQTRSIMQELLLSTWEQERKTILFVTHDIDEALFLADRVLVMSARPGRIREEMDVAMPRPRDWSMLTTQSFMEGKRRIVQLIHDEAKQGALVGGSK